jgi:hypothetical protein
LRFQFPECSPQVTPSLSLSLTHSTSPSQAQAQPQPLRSISLSRSGCQVQMPYHARPSFLALLLFLRAALIRQILARIDARQQRPSARPTKRATNADHSHFLSHANCALLTGRPISSRCGRPPRLPAGFKPFIALLDFVRHVRDPPHPPDPDSSTSPMHHRRRRDHDAGASLLRRCLTGKCRTRGRIWSMSTD